LQRQSSKERKEEEKLDTDEKINEVAWDCCFGALWWSILFS
jgi:hypothetical protein